jgi:hypothetical protein
MQANLVVVLEQDRLFSQLSAELKVRLHSCFRATARLNGWMDGWMDGGGRVRQISDHVCTHV